MLAYCLTGECSQSVASAWRPVELSALDCGIRVQRWWQVVVAPLASHLDVQGKQVDVRIGVYGKKRTYQVKAANDVWSEVPAEPITVILVIGRSSSGRNCTEAISISTLRPCCGIRALNPAPAP